MITKVLQILILGLQKNLVGKFAYMESTVCVYVCIGFYFSFCLIL